MTHNHSFTTGKQISFAAFSLQLLAAFIPSASSAAVDPPVVIPAHAMDVFFEQQLNTCQCFKWDSSQLLPTICQIDERDEDNNLIPDQRVDRKKKTITPNPDKPNTLSMNDELVFQYIDAGESQAPASMVTGRIEVTATATYGGRRHTRQLYLQCGLPPQKETQKSYIEYFPESNEARSNNYIMGFVGSVFDTTYVFENIHVRDAAAGTSSPNLLAGFELKVDLKGNLRIIRMNFTADDIIRKVTGYVHGPVRLVVLTRFSMKLIGNIPTPSMAMEELVYRDAAFFGGDLYVPMQPDYFLSKFKIMPVINLSPVVNEAEVIIDGIPEPFSLAATELPAIPGFPAWFCAETKFGHVGGGMIMGDKFRKVIAEHGSNIALTKKPDSSIDYIWTLDGIKYLKRGNYTMQFSIGASPLNDSSSCHEIAEELVPVLETGMRLVP